MQNTDQEARAIAALMPQEQRRIVLVTSAFHMPRAQQVFAAQGLMIHPYPVDFRATYKQANLLDFSPTVEAFEETSLCVWHQESIPSVDINGHRLTTLR